MVLLNKYGATTPYRSLSREMERLFEDFFGMQREGAPLAEWTPTVDIKEEEGVYKVRVDLPGVKKDDIQVEVNENRLTISGERNFDKEELRGDYHLVERGYGRFCRLFNLPGTVDSEKIDASYKDGVLEVLLPKKDTVKPKKVNIT